MIKRISAQRHEGIEYFKRHRSSCCISVGIMLLMGALLLTGCRENRSERAERGPAGQRGPMRGMMKQMMDGQLPQGIRPEDLPNPESRGARLTAEYCTSCHALPSPQMHGASEWPLIAERMFQRMEMISGMMMNRMSVNAPSKKQQETIVEYLQAHALKTMETEVLGPPTSTEEKLFRETCSQCYALPDPAQHSAEEWPAVVARMQQKIQSLGREPMTAEEIRQITDYLYQHAQK